MYRKIILETFDNIFKNSSTLLLKLIIPTIIISAANFFIPQFLTQELLNKAYNQELNLTLLIFIFLIGFILTMANISIAITVHRVLILGKNSIPRFGSFIFGLREFKFLLKTIILGIFIAILSFFVLLIPYVGIYILPILLIILVSRLALVFPALACDEKMSFIQSWRYTKNFKLLTIIMVVIFPLLFSFVVGFIYSLAIEFLIKLISPHMVILYSFLNIFITLFTISALSSIYKIIKPNLFNKIPKKEESLREIIQSSRKGIHKIIIDDREKVDFEQLKKELAEQFNKLGFTETAYARKNSWLVKNKDDEEAYVSLRHDGSNYTIQAKNTEQPILKILK